MRLISLFFLMTLTVATEPTTSVGREGAVSVVLANDRLHALPVHDRAAVVVRIADRQRVAEGMRYDLRWIGAEPGTYDLARFLVDGDGQSVPTLPTIPVRVVAILPPGMPDALDRLSPPPSEPMGGYRVVLILLGCVWLTVLPWLWRRRRRPAAPAVVEPTPDLLAQLRVLVEQARTASLDAPALARLERLLLSHWRERLDLDDLDASAALQRLRAHPEAGALLRQLDAWLHVRPGTVLVDVEELLAPYAQGRT